MTSCNHKIKLLAFLFQQSLESDLDLAFPLPNPKLRSLTVLAKSTNNFHCAAQAKNTYKAVESFTFMCFHLAQGNVIIKQICLTGQLRCILASKSHRYCMSILRSMNQLLEQRTEKLMLGVEAASEVFDSLSVSSNTFERNFYSL